MRLAPLTTKSHADNHRMGREHRRAVVRQNIRSSVISTASTS